MNLVQMCRSVLNTGNTESDFGGTFNCSEPWFSFWEAGITTVSFLGCCACDVR